MAQPLLQRSLPDSQEDSRIMKNALIGATFLAAAMTAQAGMSPTTLSVDPDVTETHAIEIDPLSGATRGFSLTVERSNPQLNELQVWRRNDPAGDFTQATSVTIPYLVAQIPFHQQSTSYHDLFVVTRNGNRLGFGMVFGESGMFSYVPLSSTYTQNVANPSRYIVAAGPNLRSGSVIEGIAVLAEPEVVLIFTDNGFMIEDSYDVYSLASGANADIVKVADVTNDLKADVLTGSTTNGEIVVHEQTTPFTATSFSPLQTLPVPGLDYFDVADLTRDGAGRQDISVVRAPTPSTSELGIFRNGGGGTPFGAADAYALDPASTHLAVADTPPGDAAPEIFVVGSAPPGSSLSEMRNDGGGLFTLSGWYYSRAANTNRVMALNYEFVGTHDPVLDEITIYPMDPGGQNTGMNQVEEIVAGGGPDPNVSAELRVFREDGVEIMTSRLVAYGSTYGLRVGSGDINGPSPLHATEEVLTGPERNPVFGGHVRAFERDGQGLRALAKVNYFAFGTLRFGVGVTGADLDQDGYAEILTGAGPGSVFGAHVRGWNFDGSQLTTMPRVNYFAYGTPKWGVNVGAGDLDGDGFAEITTCPGPGQVFPAQVRGWNVDGGNVASMPRVNYLAFGDPKEFGCHACADDLDDDGFDEIAASRGAGASQASQIRAFDFDGSSVAALPGYDFTPFGGLYGAKVAAGDVGGDLQDGAADLIMGPGPDPASGSMVEVYHGQVGTSSFEGLSGAAYGVNVSTARLSL